MRVHQPSAPLRFVLLVAMCALAFPTVARADKKEFLALTQQIATLQGQVAEADQARLEAQKDLKKIMDILVEQSALLKKLQQDMRVQDERAMVAIKDQQERLSEISDRLRASTATASQPAASGLPAASGVPGASPSATPNGPAIPPRDLYQQAYSDFARKNYDLSVQGFQEYLRLYRDTDLADNAQYWIGECLQAQGKYEDAVTAFNALLRDFVDSDKIPDARYKKGVALDALGRKSQAVLEYRFVVERFPNSQAARLAREKLGQQ
ncbi:MAG: tol-pal system protein YbgF [Vicinamibacteria bacterium]|nr:tol-pal system protein YbgF [Vicinamibacteria bacterium]